MPSWTKTLQKQLQHGKHFIQNLQRSSVNFPYEGVGDSCRTISMFSRRDRPVTSFSKMVHAPTPEKFEEAQTDSLWHGNGQACTYFEKNWGNIANMWARQLCDKLTASNNNKSRVDSHNAKIKHISLSSDKMLEALEGIVKLSCALMQVAGYCPCSMKICTFYSYEASSNMTPYAPRTWLVMLALQSTNKQPKLGKHHQYSRQFMLSQVLVAHGMRVQVRAKEKTAKVAFWSGRPQHLLCSWLKWPNTNMSNTV